MADLGEKLYLFILFINIFVFIELFVVVVVAVVKKVPGKKQTKYLIRLT